MKKLFEAYDGTVFETEEEAKEHEKFCRQPMLVIVDDDAEILEFLAAKLKQEKIKHKLFQDPLEAMNYISNNEIGHVYTDYHMKGFGLSGKWIKEICDQKKISCSIVSGDPDIADIAKIDFVRNCIPFIKGSPAFA
jgi:ActR/RegA family two-component response regulator